VYASASVDSAHHEVNIFFPHEIERRSTSSRIPGVAASAQELHGRIERTVALIKPDAIAAGVKGNIVKRIADEGFTIIKEKEVLMTLDQAESFYQDNRGKPYFEELVNWISGYIIK
jgi:nucleoside diphosphate kinase